MAYVQGSEVTAVGFEPTPLRTGALSQRLRPLGQTVLFTLRPVHHMNQHDDGALGAMTHAGRKDAGCAQVLHALWEPPCRVALRPFSLLCLTSPFSQVPQDIDISFSGVAFLLRSLCSRR